MADHVRKQIRAALATAIAAGSSTVASARVYTSRTQPIPEGQDNAIRIYMGDEPEIRAAAKGAGAAKVRLERTAELVIEALSRKVSGSDDEVDQILKEVEVLISANQSAGGAKHIHPKRVETEYDGELEKDVAQARLVCEVLYFTVLDAPDVAI